jgi:hypothetical protein
VIIQGNELQLYDLIASYTQRYQCSCLYFDLTRFNALDEAKKEIVIKFYEEFIDEYVLDIIRQGRFNTIRFDDEDLATINAVAWFPKIDYCPDEDHYIHAYVVNVYGDIVWENIPEKKLTEEQQ